MGKIRIRLLSDLCAASGESAGNAIDMDVATDRWGIPYIPGRRIKGCLRQAAEDLAAFGCSAADQDEIRRLFGDEHGNPGALTVENAYLSGIESLRNAIDQAGEDPELKGSAAPGNITGIFSYVRGSTAMEEGRAKEGTLRFERVLHHYNPLQPGKETELICSIRLADGKSEELLKLCCQATRQIGLNRNRGLGSVAMNYISEETESEKRSEATGLPAGGRCRIEYRLKLNAPIVTPGLTQQITAISSRAVIGCLAESWKKQHPGEEDIFARLFLTGETQWQELTPMIEGKRSCPVPRMIVRLKSQNATYENMLDGETHGEGKRKSLDGYYAAILGNGFLIAGTNQNATYHHSTARNGKDGTLYIEASIEEGALYGGTVSVPADLAEEAMRLLNTTDFRFGRSKSAQYGACELAGSPVCTPDAEEILSTGAGETVYAVLLSDLIYSEDGMNLSDAETIRKAIAKTFHLQNEKPEDARGRKLNDNCTYRETGGYQLQWQMRKPVYEAVQAGSYYCFRAGEESIPREMRIGEFPQEGLGLIRLFTAGEMAGMNQIREEAVDRPTSRDPASSEMRAAIMVNSAKKMMDQKAIRYLKEHRNINREVQVGRLRLMLTEAKNYEDLLNRIENIKTPGYRSASRKLAQELYGTGTTPEGTTMLGEAGELWNRMDENARKQLMQNWKQPLSRILTLAHYQQKEEGSL